MDRVLAEQPLDSFLKLLTAYAIFVIMAIWARSSAWLERVSDKDEVPGSNPGAPTS